MYKIIAIQHIHANFSSCSSDDVWLEKRFWLPFPPQIGISIKLGEDLYIEPIEIVYHHGSLGYFKVYVPSDKELYNKQFNTRGSESHIIDKERLYEIVWEYRQAGWKLEHE